MNTIRAITLDVGGTLIEPWPSVGHIYADVAGRHGLCGPTPEQLNINFVNAWKRKAAFDYTQASWSQLVASTFGEAWPGDTQISQKVFEDLYAEFSKPEVWRIYDDVMPALQSLRQSGYRLGILSNWDERLAPLLKALRLMEWFDCAVISHNLGTTKPGRRMFDHAAKALGCEPSQMLHVGDSVREDIEGATQAGWHAARLRRGYQNSQWPDLDSLTQIIPSLETNT